MLNLKSTRIAVAVAATLFTINPLQASDDWFEQQRSISDGYSQPNEAAESQGKPGQVTGDSSWFEQQRAMSDGYSPPASGFKSSYVGAKLEKSPQDDFIRRGMRITDGTPE